MSDYEDGYKRGGVRVSNDPGYEKGWWIYLPHRCDQWLIGGPDQAYALIEDLRVAIDVHAKKERL